ncbi:MAG: tyrosinase family protein [Myxococcales bacterium]|nr:tyrosinase family protein [Myxococcales bacterium]
MYRSIATAAAVVALCSASSALAAGPNPACSWFGAMSAEEYVFYNHTGITGYERGFLIHSGNYDTTNSNIDYTIEYLEDPMDCTGEQFILRFPLHGQADHVEIEVWEATGAFLGRLEADKGTLPTIYDQTDTALAPGDLGPFVITNSMMNQVSRILLFPLLDARTLGALPQPLTYNGAAPANWLQELVMGMAFNFAIGQREALYSLFTFRRMLVAMNAAARQRASDAIDAHIYDVGEYSATVWQDHPFVNHMVDVTAQVAGVTWGGFFNGHRHYLEAMEDHLFSLPDTERVPFRRLPAWQSDQTVPAEFNIGILNTVAGTVMPATYDPAAICGSYDPALYAGTLRDQLLAAQADVYGDVEPWHGSTHVAIGGDMSAVATAARAPIFFSWHMTVDTPWHNWQLCWPAWDPTDYDWL